MNISRKATVGAFAATLLITAGCAKPPQEAIDGTRATLEGAQKAGSVEWAAQEWEAAQDAMDAVNAELELQEAKMAIARSYKETERLVSEAATKATAAEAAAVANKEAARVAANDDLEAARSALASAQTLATELQACPRKPKGFAADMELMTGSLTTLAEGLAPIESSLASEDYLGVSTEARALQAQIETLVADMQAAKTKIGC